MPLEPDIVAEFAIGPVSPPDDVLENLKSSLDRGALPDFGNARKVLPTFWDSSLLGSFVVSVGIWLDEESFTDDELRQALIDASNLLTGQTASLFISAAAIQARADAAWKKEADKTFGDTTLANNIAVHLSNGKITTEVDGVYDPWFLFSTPFTAKITETLSLRPSGSIPPLSTVASYDINVDAIPKFFLSLLIGHISPALGAATFFAGESVAEEFVPKRSGAGGILAALWPAFIFTEVVPPFLSGKFRLNWNGLKIDQRGVPTRGTYTPAQRIPKVTIIGPTKVTVREAFNWIEVATYHLALQDLRPPLTVTWSGIAKGSGSATERAVVFRNAGHFNVSVNVTDADGLTADDSLPVDVTGESLEPGQQPF